MQIFSELAAERELELNGGASEEEEIPLTAEQLEEIAQAEIREHLQAEDNASAEGFVCPLFKVKMIIDQQWVDEYDRTGKHSLNSMIKTFKWKEN